MWYGTFSCAGIVNHMAKMQGPATEEKKTLKEVKDYIKNDDITVFGFFDDEDSTLYEIYEDTGMIYMSN